MKIVIRLISFIGCCTGIFQFAWADVVLWPESVIVVTSNQRPVSNIHVISIVGGDARPDIQILNLDTVTSIEQLLSDGLPLDPMQARIMVDQRITQIGRSRLDNELRTAYLPLGTMMAYALDRFPVIIFDRETVIYGVTDLEQAMNRYRQWIEGKQEGFFNE